MKIEDNRLFKDNGEAYPFSASPNSGGSVEHEYLVMHYTAGRSAESSVEWLTNPVSKASAHVVIGRDGSIAQLVPFDTKAWHAGQSTWENLSGLNQYSLGIELDNAGRLERQGNRWYAWFGDEYDDDVVMEAVHKHETQPSGWHIYTQAQIEAALEVASLLVSKYSLRDVLGHDDISPGRKSDPGPAFPMASFRGHVLGRKEEESVQYETTANLNIRSGPGTQYDTIPGGPLPTGTRVEILNREGRWGFVDVPETLNGVMDLQGWVHTTYLKRVA